MFFSTLMLGYRKHLYRPLSKNSQSWVWKNLVKSELSKKFTIMKYFEGSFVNNFFKSKFGMKLIWIEVCSARKIRFCKNLENPIEFNKL